MFSIVKTHIGVLADQIKSQKLSLTSGIVVLLTSLLNYCLNKSFFKCPKLSHEMYGWSFLLCPALFLATLTLLASPGLSRAVSGFCLTDKDVTKRAFGGKRKRTWIFLIRSISIALCMATIAFLSWIVVTLMTTDTYACIKLGPANEAAQYKADKEKYGTQSKAAGLILLTICLMISLVINLALKCCFTDIPEKDLPSMRRYDKIEALAASKELTSLIEKSADATGKAMVKRFLLHNCHPKMLKQETPEDRKAANMMEGKDNEVNANEFITRNDVEQLRRFLALRYPRLDGEEHFEYCRQSELPENFDYDKIDNVPKCIEVREKTEIPFAFVEDKMNGLCNKSNIGSWEPTQRPLL